VVALRSLDATTIEVEADPEGVIELLDSSPIPLADHPRREDCLIARIHLRPLIEDEETLLTVRCGEAEAIASIEVRPSARSPTRLEFERARYQLAHGKRRSLVIRAPVEVTNKADTTVVRVHSSDTGIVVLGGSVKLEFDEDELCFVGRVHVDPRVLGARGTLTATLGAAHATCEVVVAQHDGGGPVSRSRSSTRRRAATAHTSNASVRSPRSRSWVVTRQSSGTSDQARSSRTRTR
jgi:hypothetical protein